MDYFPFGYQPIEASTWAYLSSLLMLALFFKFNRFWSIRNLDLMLIILLAPGLLMVHYGQKEQASLEQAAQFSSAVVKNELDAEQALANEVTDPPAIDPKNVAKPNSKAKPKITNPSSAPSSSVSSPNAGPNNGSPAGKAANKSTNPQVNSSGGDESSLDGQDSARQPTSVLSVSQKTKRFGFVWLFVVGAIWMVRLFYDPMLVRKPMLEPNLTVGGLVFLTCSLTIFLFANVLMSQPSDLEGPTGAANLVRRNAQEAGDQLLKYGPGYPLLHVIPAIPTFELNPKKRQQAASNEVIRRSDLVEVARFMALLSQIAIIVGLIFIGLKHFGSFQMGVGMAAIFLMLPYTAQFGGDSMHLLPGALLIWAIAAYRRPAVAGVLIGIAAGVCYYPLFLLPLWISFYWKRGRMRFLLGALGAIVLVVSSLALTSADFAGFMVQLKSIFGFILPRQEGLGGIWALNWESWFRLPLLVGFIVLCVSYAVWPTVKDLACLISSTATAMVAVQFWHGDGGGLYMAWYLPLILLVIFRPNLDDKVAISVLEEPRNRPSDDLDFAA